MGPKSSGPIGGNTRRNQFSNGSVRRGTILSGPAASIVGARWLTGASDALVSDIGGTTTDVALLRDGRPAIDPAGALVGGMLAMVRVTAGAAARGDQAGDLREIFAAVRRAAGELAEAARRGYHIVEMPVRYLPRRWGR